MRWRNNWPQGQILGIVFGEANPHLISDLRAPPFGLSPFAHGRRSWFFSGIQSHELIEIKCTATPGSDFSKFDLVPAVHSVHLIALLANPDRFARNYAVNNFFIFGPWPSSHPTATPINSVTDVVINVRALVEIEQ